MLKVFCLSPSCQYSLFWGDELSTAHGFFLTKREIHQTIIQQCPKNAVIVLAVFQEICFRARYNGNVVDGLKLGECFFGRAKLAAYLGVSEQSVRSAIDALVDLTIIQQTSNKQGTKVSICDLSVIAGFSPTSDEQVTNKQPLTNNNNNNNNKEEKGKGSAKASPPPFGRILGKGELEQFVKNLQHNLNTQKPLSRSLVLNYLRCFESLGAAEDFLADVFERAQAKFPDDEPAQLKYLGGAMHNHSVAEKLAAQDGH